MYLVRVFTVNNNYTIIPHLNGDLIAGPGILNGHWDVTHSTFEFQFMNYISLWIENGIQTFYFVFERSSRMWLVSASLRFKHLPLLFVDMRLKIDFITKFVYKMNILANFRLDSTNCDETFPVFITGLILAVYDFIASKYSDWFVGRCSHG